MANILILIGGHLCTQPRCQKEAAALAAAGHKVMVRGVWFDPVLRERDRKLLKENSYKFEPVVDMGNSYWHNFRERLFGRMAREAFRRLSIFSPALLGYGVRAMLTAARHDRADLTIVHSEAGLWVANRLLDEGYNVGIDFEDWFSEDLLPETRKARPLSILKGLEKRLAQKCMYCLTTSVALANALSTSYQAPLPATVYNVFPWDERVNIDNQTKDRKVLDMPSIHWFSQTVGSGRGLEVLMKALPMVSNPCEVHIRGNYPDYARRWLEPLMPTVWRHRIFIHETVPNSELLSRIAEHDIGLALEQTDVPSRNLTITNKFFQYMQAGLAVIATSTVGQREVFLQAPEIGRLIPPGDPVALAEALDELLSSPEKCASAKKAALAVAKEQFCWEKQSATIIEKAAEVLNEGSKQEAIV